ncbi:MAG: dTDP-4-dehydrorhamnose reductase [Verrucomicrobiota bacterium]|nr:dTDP-4-dehydrorhamnose reductase [Verrucomicrobiota bacterium]
MFVWVTGAGGLVGSSLRKRAHLATTHKEADVADLDALWRVVHKHPKITHIINAAAFTNVDLAEEREEEAFLVNAMGPKNLAVIAHDIGAKLVHISTDYVFGGKGASLLKEEDKTVPCNAYGRTKLQGEKELLRVLPSATIVRTSWLFGSGGRTFVTRMVEQMGKREKLLLTNDQWSRPTYVQDLVEALFHMLEVPGVFQFAGHGITTRYEFALAVREEMKKLGIPVLSEIVPVPSSSFKDRAERPRYSAMDTHKIEAILGPIRPWHDGLRDFLRERIHAGA